MHRSSAIGAIATVALAAALLPGAASGRSPTVVRPAHELATLLAPHAVHATPYRDGPGATNRMVAAWRPLTGTPTALPVTGQAFADGTAWLRVKLPGRPNGTEGWIAQAHTVRTTTAWGIVVRLSARKLSVYHGDALVRSFSAIVGKGSTPTPLGRFFVEESVRMRAGSAGAPFALALSARSLALQRFEGGPGQIAIHGMAGLAGVLGTASSHGCIRIARASITWLAARIPSGTPVTIRR